MVMTENRKRIVFVLPDFSTGGSERVLLTFIGGIDRAVYDPVLVVLNGAGGLKHLVPDWLRVCDLGTSSFLAALPGIYKLFKSCSPDMVVTTLVHMNMMVLLLRPFFKKTKFVVRESNLPSSMERGQKYPAWVRAIYRFVMKRAYRILYPRADLVISPAGIIRDEFRTYLGMSVSERHLVLYNPVDADDLRQDRDDSSVVRFIAVGRLHRQKGFDRLIAALADFSPDFDWTLDIYGDGDQRDELSRLIVQNRLSEHVFLKGLSREPWRQVADCLLLPSRWEGLPNVVLEALAVGTPVIATQEAGGIVEIAELAPAGAVRLVANMTQFCEQMKQVSRDSNASAGGSALPGVFQKNYVIGQFYRALSTV